MNDHPGFEARLQAGLRARASVAARPFDAAGIVRNARGPARDTGNLLARWRSRSRTRRWVALTIVFASAVLGAAVIGSRPVEPTPPPMSNGDGWIAFTVENYRTGPSDIFLVRPGVPERLLSGARMDGLREVCPQFSPDGTRIAYLSGPADAQIEGQNELAIVTLATVGSVAGTREVVATGLSPHTCPKWAPDSQSVAYMEGRTLWVIRLDGRSTAIDAGHPTSEPGSFDWSPDGTEIAYVGPASIWLVPINGGEPRRVYETDDDVTLDELDWSPAGQRIVVAAERVTRLPDSAIREELPPRIIHVDGAVAPLELTGLGSLAWSPDGQRLAAVRETQRGGLAWSELVTLAPDGHDERVVADLRWSIRGLTWSPDGSELAYVDDNPSSPVLLVVGVSGNAEPLSLLSQPYYLGHTSSQDLSWQAANLPGR